MKVHTPPPLPFEQANSPRSSETGETSKTSPSPPHGSADVRGSLRSQDNIGRAMLGRQQLLRMSSDSHNVSNVGKVDNVGDVGDASLAAEIQALSLAVHASSAPAGDRDLTLITRWANHARYDNLEKQLLYARFMAGRIDATANELKQGKMPYAFDALWTTARKARCAIFVENGEPAEYLTNFKSSRNAFEPLNTPVNDHYEYIRGHITELVSHLHLAGSSAHDLPAQKNYSLVKSDGSNVVHPSRDCKLKIIAHLPNEHVDVSPVNWFFNLDHENKPCHLIVCNAAVAMIFPKKEPDGVEKIAQHIDQLLKDAGAADKRACFDKSMEAFWWMCAAPPDARGAAAKAQFVMKAVLQSKDIELPPSAFGKAPDLEAMSRSLEDWQAMAHTVFNMTDADLQKLGNR